MAAKVPSRQQAYRKQRALDRIIAVAYGAGMTRKVIANALDLTEYQVDQARERDARRR